tara:strand:- start:1049 stop:2521 length:1473 start_codon:yes stop_codon:yes gene_type:complete
MSLFVSIVWFDDDYEILKEMIKNFLKKAQNEITIGVCLSCQKDNIEALIEMFIDENVKFIPLPKEVNNRSYGRYLTQQMIQNEKYYLHIDYVKDVIQNWDTEIKKILKKDFEIICHCNGTPFIKDIKENNGYYIPLIDISQGDLKNSIYLDDIVFTFTTNIKKCFHKTNLNKFFVNEVMTCEHIKENNKIRHVNLSSIFDCYDNIIPDLPDELDETIEMYIANLYRIYSSIFHKKNILYQIIFEFEKYIIKKLENKLWEITNIKRTSFYHEVGNDYKTHTLQSEDSEKMFKIYRNGCQLEDYMTHEILAINGKVRYDCEYKEDKLVVNENILLINSENSMIKQHFDFVKQNFFPKYEIYYKNISDLSELTKNHANYILFINKNVYFNNLDLHKLNILIKSYDVVTNKDLDFMYIRRTAAASYILNSKNIKDEIDRNPKANIITTCTSKVSNKFDLNKNNYLFQKIIPKDLINFEKDFKIFQNLFYQRCKN